MSPEQKISKTLISGLTHDVSLTEETVAFFAKLAQPG